MTSLLFGIALSALLSSTSLLIVLFRVSPLTSTQQALPAFLVSLFLTISTVGALFFLVLWRYVPIHSWDGGKLMRIALRQGFFLGTGTMVLLFFYLFGLLTWWIAVVIYAVFLLIELALEP